MPITGSIIDKNVFIYFDIERFVDFGKYQTMAQVKTLSLSIALGQTI